MSGVNERPHDGLLDTPQVDEGDSGARTLLFYGDMPFSKEGSPVTLNLCGRQLKR